MSSSLTAHQHIKGHSVPQTTQLKFIKNGRWKAKRDTDE